MIFKILIHKKKKIENKLNVPTKGLLYLYIIKIYFLCYCKSVSTFVCSKHSIVYRQPVVFEKTMIIRIYSQKPFMAILTKNKLGLKCADERRCLGLTFVSELKYELFKRIL